MLAKLRRMSRGILHDLPWHAVMCGALLLIPSLWLAPPALWSLDRWSLLVLAGSVAAYLLAALGLFGRTDNDASKPSPQTILIHCGAWFGVWLLAIVLGESGLLGRAMPTYDRRALLTALAVGPAGLFWTAHGRRFSRMAMPVCAAMVLATLAGHAAFQAHWLPRPEQPTPRQVVSTIDTLLYQLKVTEYLDHVPRSREWKSGIGAGGGLAEWGEDQLLATGDGRLYVIGAETTDGLQVQELPYHVPLNVDEFRAGARKVFADSPTQEVEFSRFRVSGTLVQQLGDTRRLLAFHHRWDDAGNCYALRLSALEGSPEQFREVPVSLRWRTVFETAPCLTLNTDNPVGPRFEGIESGGGMAALGPDEILLAVGDHGFDGVARPEMLAQDPSAHYGKILRVNVATGAAEVFSSGHRNPQGLHITDTGEIWETEHGPRGGDELNLIVEGTNYGWPLVTYGTAYSRRIWPLNQTPGRHEGFERPIYSFVPSVGLSPVTSIHSEAFKLWQGDLLMGSLVGQSLQRTRLREGRLLFTEAIPLGHRVRDIRFSQDGRLWVWTDANTILVIEPSEANSGDAIAAQCRACHGLSIWDGSSALGPSLANIVSRPVAARSDFAYSEAMQKVGGRWTRERLDAFVANPQALVPGTTMAFPGIQDAEQRRLLIEYLSNIAQDL